MSPARVLLVQNVEVKIRVQTNEQVPIRCQMFAFIF